MIYIHKEINNKIMFGKQKIRGTSDDPVMRAYYNLKGDETIREKVNPPSSATRKDISKKNENDEWDYNLDDSNFSMITSVSLASLGVLILLLKQFV